jgi:hypothetical protein
MLGLIVMIILVGVLVWGATAIIGAIPMNPTFKKVAIVLVIVVAVLWLIGALFGVNVFAGHRAPVLRF